MGGRHLSQSQFARSPVQYGAPAIRGVRKQNASSHNRDPLASPPAYDTEISCISSYARRRIAALCMASSQLRSRHVRLQHSPSELQRGGSSAGWRQTMDDCLSIESTTALASYQH